MLVNMIILLPCCWLLVLFIKIKDKRIIILYAVCWCLSLSGICWTKKTGIFILGSLTKITVDQNKLFGSNPLIDYCIVPCEQEIQIRAEISGFWWISFLLLIVMKAGLCMNMNIFV